MILNRKYQPKLNKISDILIPQPERIKLDNNISTYLINAGKQDIVRIELVADAGSFHDDHPLTAKYTAEMLIEGTRAHTSEQLAKTVDYYGFQLYNNSDRDIASITIYTLKKHIKKAITLLKEIIAESVFPEEELAILNKKEKQKHLVNMQRVRFIAHNYFNKLIFPDSPYGKVTELKDFDTIKRNHIQDFYNRFYNPENYFIIISGKIDNKLAVLINEHWGNIPLEKKTNFTDKELNSNNYKPQTDLIQKEDALQSAIRIGKPLFNKLHPDYINMKILVTFLGGFFGSRLMSNLREDKGYTYGIGAGIKSLKRSGFFYIATEVGADVRRKAIDEIYFEIQKLQDDKIQNDELNTVKQYLLGSIIHSLDNPVGLAENLKNLVIYDLDYSFIKKTIEKVNNITSEKLQELANKYLGKHTLSELVAGK